MEGMRATHPAVFPQLHPIGMGFLVLTQVVISAFALLAFHNDTDSRIDALSISVV